MIDLHCHTTCSDGTLTPAELVAAAEGLGLAAVAICDHDTVAAHLLVEHPRLWTGVELSVEFVPGTFHLLGYGVRPTDPALTAALAGVQAWRAERNEVILDLLATHGLPVTREEAFAAAGDAPLGRPHLARILVNKGVVGSIQEAFDRYFAAGRPCYAPKSRLTPQAAIDLVHAAGGAALLAHPYQLGLSDEALADQVAAWQALGLDGIEVYYSRHTPEQITRYQVLADELGLCVTAGSDFHGATKPDIALGQISGEWDEQAVLSGLRRCTERWAGRG